MADIVTWTTPYQAAERAFRDAGEALETGTRERAMDLLREHQAHLNELVAFLIRESVTPARPISEWTYEERVNALRHRYPYPLGCGDLKGDKTVTQCSGKAIDP